MSLHIEGKTCSFPGCTQHDFLASRCGTCKQIFCGFHSRLEEHNCTRKDSVVPTCPLCNRVVPLTSPDESVDKAVDAHIRRGCNTPAPNSSSTSSARTNYCAMDGCTRNDFVLVQCDDCKNSYCLNHRFPTDHKCRLARRGTPPPPQPPPQPPVTAKLLPTSPPPTAITPSSSNSAVLQPPQAPSNTASTAITPPGQPLDVCVTVLVYFPIRFGVPPCFMGLPKSAPFQSVSFFVSNRLKLLCSKYQGERLGVFEVPTLQVMNPRENVGGVLRNGNSILVEFGPPLSDDVVAYCMTYFQT
eukprot:PhF_6_TR22667/c0_g1_i1/m.32278